MADPQKQQRDPPETAVSGTYRFYGYYDDAACWYDLERDTYLNVVPHNSLTEEFNDLSVGNVVTARVSGDADDDQPWVVTELSVDRDSKFAFRAVEGYTPDIAEDVWESRSRGQTEAVRRVTRDGRTVAEIRVRPQEDPEYGDLWEAFSDGRMTFEPYFSVSEDIDVRDVYFLNPLDQPYVVVGLFPADSDEFERFDASVVDAADTGADADAGDRPPIEEFEYNWQDSTDVSFADVGGMETVKAELRTDIIRPMTVDREKAKEFGIPLPNVLLYGPPGTGKTFLAKALATELGVPMVQLSASDVTSRWINASSERIGRLFDEARAKAADAGGAVVFLDELDAVLTKRGGMDSHEEDRKVVNEFLNHLQDVTEDDVLFVGATNKREDLDDAAVRSGRIDKEIYVGLPDAEARGAILAAQLRDRPHDLDDDELAGLAAQTEEFTAADLAGLVEDAARNALFERGADRVAIEDFEASLPEHAEEATDQPSVDADADPY